MNIQQMNEPFDRGLANIIKSRGLKQVFVAEKAGYSAQELNDMLNGRKLIKACDVLNLSRALEVTANDVYEAAEKEVI